MKTAWLLGFALLAGGTASLAFLGACATNDDGIGPGELPDPNTLPDGSPEASNDDAADAATDLPCTPHTLCPAGLFGADTVGGALDLRTRINAIRGRSANDVWAVGARGAVGHFDGTTWKRLELGSQDSIGALWLRDSGEVGFASWALYSRGGAPEPPADAGPPSADGWLARGPVTRPPELNDGFQLTSAWSSAGSEWGFCTSVAPPDIPGVSDLTTNGIWRLRYGPEEQRFEVVRLLPPGTCATFGCRRLTSVHGISNDDVWAVGYRGSAVHITSASSDSPKVAPFDTQTWAGFSGVWAASGNDVWAVGGGGTIRHYTGHPDTFDVVDAVPTTEALNAVWGTGPNDIWAVGNAATVLHYDGAAWSRVDVAALGGRRPDLYTVWASAPGHVWIGGDGVVLSLGGRP